MDEMDYTMENPGPNSVAAGRQQYQCHQPQIPSSINSFASQARENQHYDPVHDATTWYHHDNSPGMSRASYMSPQNVPQWPAPSFLPVHNSFQAYPDLQRSAPRSPDQPSFRSPRGFLDMPWNEVQGFEPLRFGYSSYSNPSSVPAESTNLAVASSHPTSISTLTRSQVPNLSSYEREGQISANQHYRAQMMAAVNSTTRGTNENATEERIIRHNPFSPEPRNGGNSRSARQTAVSRVAGNVDATHPRRHIAAWDSDEDEDTTTGAEVYTEFQRRQQDILFGDGHDEERSLAAMRGAVTTGKRVPSKEAISSLEIVKLEDLTGNDRTCIICYNDLGVENPEGLTENPLRLPKCKHIFGDKCIKKWFEDSDSCPYCRDKLPSELSTRKSINYDAYRATRERIQFLSQRAQILTSVRPGSLAASQRALEEYEYIMNRDVSSWGLPPSTRSSTMDSPERRRQARGRIGSSRATHQPARPTSVGSARFINPTFSHQLVSPRPSVQNTPSTNYTNDQAPRRSITPGLTRQEGSAHSGQTFQTPQQNRLSGDLRPSPSSSPEAVSPAIAIGSVMLTRDNQTDRPGRAALSRGLDVTALPFAWNFNSRLDMGNLETDSSSSGPQRHAATHSSHNQSVMQPFHPATASRISLRPHLVSERNISEPVQLEALENSANGTTDPIFRARWSR